MKEYHSFFLSASLIRSSYELELKILTETTNQLSSFPKFESICNFFSLDFRNFEMDYLSSKSEG